MQSIKMKNNLDAYVEEVADKIQQHFFKKGAVVSKEDYEFCVKALTSTVERTTEENVKKLEGLRKKAIKYPLVDSRGDELSQENHGYLDGLGEAIATLKQKDL